MRPTPHPSARHWDGSPVVAHRVRRSLQVSPGSVSRLLRCGQSGRCRECGNRIEWYHRSTERPVRLHPQELPAARVPAACRWHVSCGVAHPAGDGSSWCRLPHAVVCPARDAHPTPPELAGLRRSLAVNSRRLIEAGAFAPPPPSPQAPAPAVCRPARPIVQLLYIRYLAARPVEEIQCVAQTRRRNRCTSPLLTSDAPPGTWRLVPATATSGQLALPAEVMAIYDLGGLPYAEQMRWRVQRCPQHAATPAAADLAVADWEPFEPLRHHEHIHTRLPDRNRRPGPASRVRRAVRP
ncbi:hypothetical protein EJ357_47595 [Streptomyces cyaneochromogenes]|uniref:Uncharacterized protein n=1 Tax=Streptomyces cyaneochromogenes TaxID=2496836 RepID=A0A3Q9EVM3_9ACTN|nr:DUF6083 domain-containing protein [Streptomyces cyaneochromogenes]AZQ32125.1 hypothetical protein EJ357_00335 [Streptomyces cyaneochromogenes]AZQ40098.1 hypothetical protein EJ357_47595 [Streptomyces cyaneochromogenes]